MFSPDRLSIDVIISPEIEVAKALDRSTQIAGAFKEAKNVKELTTLLREAR
jgi:Trk K+ transport system NAD-binding subunit